jgi:hypothetical protein
MSTGPDQEGSPAAKLADQAVEAESVQNARLVMAEDDVYGHVATFATASAMSGIAWEHKPHLVKADEMGARLRGKGFGRFNSKFPQDDWPAHTRAVLHLQGGVALRSAIYFHEVSDLEIARTLPDTFDDALVGEKAKKGIFLSSSTVVLERPSAIYGVPPMRLGVLAVHSSPYDDIRVEPINETVRPEDFEETIGMIARSEEIAYDEEQDGPVYGVATGVAQFTAVTTRPEGHFDFHAAIGVPEATVELAKHNYAAIAAHMNLPYELPSQS